MKSSMRMSCVRVSRMKFVDEQGEGASPTLSALRVYRDTARRDDAAFRPMRRSTSPRRRCSRSSAMTA